MIKVGDRVKTISGHVWGHKQGIVEGLAGDMASIRLDTGGSYFRTEVFMLEKLPFTKEDLHTGMIAELRNGQAFYVLRGTRSGDLLKEIKGPDHIRLENYRDDLTHVCSNFTIDHVRETMVREMLSFDTSWNSIYDRISETMAKEMTIEEIEDTLGHKIKIVGDRK